MIRPSPRSSQPSLFAATPAALGADRVLAVLRGEGEAPAGAVLTRSECWGLVPGLSTRQVREALDALVESGAIEDVGDRLYRVAGSRAVRGC